MMKKEAHHLSKSKQRRRVTSKKLFWVSILSIGFYLVFWFQTALKNERHYGYDPSLSLTSPSGLKGKLRESKRGRKRALRNQGDGGTKGDLVELRKKHDKEKWEKKKEKYRLRKLNMTVPKKKHPWDKKRTAKNATKATRRDASPDMDFPPLPSFHLNSRNLPKYHGKRHLEIDTSEPFLNYQLYNDRPYNITYGFFTKCYIGVKTNKWGRKPIRRVPLSSEFESILGVQTYVQTNLKILMLGDSVGIQFHQLLEEAAGATWEHRKFYQFAWGAHESVSVAAPVDGGGVLGAFRMTGMLLPEGKDKPPPNAGGGGWLPDHVEQLLNHTYSSIDDLESKQSLEVQKFDSMVFRIPHGWLKLEEITEATLTESLHMANKLFGIKTAVVLTLPLNNNVQTMEQLNQLQRTNEMIRNVVKNWNVNHKDDVVENVLLMEFGEWADGLTELNARLAGMDQTPQNYTLERLGCNGKYPPSLAMVCTDVVEPGSCTCNRNMVSIDGLHWCMESVGGRIIGAMACLLKCPLDHSGDREKMKDCEKRCNAQFMSLTPHDEIEASIQ